MRENPGNDVAGWLATLGLERYAPDFVRQSVDLHVLPRLTADDLKELGVALGHRKVILEAIGRLKATGSGGVTGEAQRRQLTVMFCDMVGSTALSSRLDPEDLREVVRFYQNLCAGIIGRHGGFIAAFHGDGILVYFGYPQAREDAPESAIRAGLEMIKALGSITGPHGTRLEIRLGVATGVMVVGDLIGHGAAEQVAATGKVPNLAARLQGEAKPGELIISDATRRLVGGLFECQDLSLHRFKGIEEEVRIWRVVGECREAERYDALRGARVGSFVGREQELALLAGLFGKVLGGRGQAVLVRGEAGIGKSSLVREFATRVAGNSPVRIFLQCSPHHRNTPLHPVVINLQRAARFAADDPPQARLAKIGQMLPAESRARGVPLLATLLSVPLDGTATRPPLTARAQKAATLALVADYTLSLADAHPVLMLVEDAHWMDPTSEELALQLFEGARDRRVLIVVTGRPEYCPAWMDRPDVTRLELGRLDPAEARRLVEAVAGDSPLHERVVEQILARAGGVPLFAEELTRNVIESGPGGEGVHEAIPMTLRDILMARIDRLGETKEVAQVAAALGRRFTVPTLAAVTGQPQERLEKALERLVAGDLVVARGGSPAAEYAFRHALVQDAAYESLLRADRKRLHQAIAQALEAGFPEIAEREPEALAYHFERAGLHEAAARYWLRAGQRALAASANMEAIGHLQNGIAAFAQLPRGAGPGRLDFDLHLSLGQASYVARGPAAADTIAAYTRAQELVEEVDDAPLRYMLLYGIFAGYHFASRFDLAREPALRLLELAGRAGDAAHLCQAHRMLGYVSFFRGETAAAREHFESLAQLYDPGRHGAMAARFGADCLSASRGFHAVLDCLCGKPESATRMGLDSLDYARRLGHPATIGWAFAALSYVHYFALEVDETLAISAEGIAYCDANNIAAWGEHCRLFHLWAQSRRGDPRERIPAVRSAIAAAAATSLLGVPVLRCLLAQVLALADEARQAVEVTGVALAEIESNGQEIFHPLVLHVRGECLERLAQPPREEILACYRDSLAAARRVGALLLELRAANSLARLAADGRDFAEARDVVARLCAEFGEGFAVRDLRETRELLAATEGAPRSRAVREGS